MDTFKPIRKLSQDVVNRIAAGEVIQRPKNVVKELIENSLDANATAINVTIKYGTDMELIQVQDNGQGIASDDLRMACERFCTSKLITFDDLSDMQTYGFRGEALASMSHVARVTIRSKTRTSLMGSTMDYEDGRPTKDKPTSVAANDGTIIMVRDLFYNSRVRKEALSNLGEEYRSIVQLLSKYALNNPSVAFSLRKNDSSSSDVRTTCGSTDSSNISLLFGPKYSENLIDLEFFDEKLNVEITGMVGNFSSSLKAYHFILFINKRLVDCNPLKRAVEAIYRNKLPRGIGAFIYMSLLIDAKTVDVNVHPTKNEVRFLNEDDIIKSLVQHLEDKLIALDSIKLDAFSTLMSNKTASPKASAQSSATASPATQQPRKSSLSVQRPEHVVRTCHEDQTIDTMFRKQETKVDGKNNYRRTVTLTSIINLRKEIKTKTDLDHRKAIAQSTFVGCVRGSIPTCFIQFDTSLLLLNLEKITYQFFYQTVLNDFINFGQIDLPTPLSLTDLAFLHLKQNGSENALGQAKEVAKKLFERRDMFNEYFAVVIDKNYSLSGLPILIDGYTPDQKKLPAFICELALNALKHVEETSCLKSITQVIARFYAFAPVHGEAEFTFQAKLFENLIYPRVKKDLRPDGDGFYSIADVHGLYKVFKRC